MLNRHLSSVLISVLFGLAALTATAASDKPQEVRDLRYGAMLYEYFQSRYFESLVELAVAEERGGVEYHAQHAELMKGGISLSYGLDRDAEEIFSRLLDDYEDKSVRDQAWYYLGKIAYQREEIQRAGDILGKVGKDLPEDLEDEYTFINTNLLIQRGDVKQAGKTLKNFNKKSIWRPYAQFNYAVANHLAADADATEALWSETLLAFEKVGGKAKRSQEIKALIDRANLAAGYALLSADRQRLAIEYFKRVRLEGPYASKAMLGYGWAASRAEDYALALTPWQNLSERSLISPSVQESYLAIPYAYEKLGAERQALEQFENAATAFTAELVRIDEAVQTLRSADIVKLFAIDLDENALSWLSAVDEIEMQPQTAYLTHLLARHRFHSGMRDLRDLFVLRANLEEWRNKIDSMNFALASRTTARERNQAELDRGAMARITANEQRLNDLRAKLEKIEKSRDVFALMDEEQAAAYERINRAKARASSLRSGGADISEQEAKLSLMHGLLRWNLHEVFDERLWAAKEALASSQQSLSDSRDADARLQRLLVSTTDIKALENKVVVTTSRLLQLVEKNDQAIVAQRGLLAQLAIDELLKQRKRIATYLTQARTSIARLYDISTTRSEERGGQ